MIVVCIFLLLFKYDLTVLKYIENFLLDYLKMNHLKNDNLKIINFTQKRNGKYFIWNLDVHSFRNYRTSNASNLILHCNFR